MRALVRRSFERDVIKLVRKEKNSRTIKQIEQTIDELKTRIESTSADQIAFPSSNVKKLRKGVGCYRVRVGDYRIGLKVVEGAVEFARLLHRSDFYRHFP